MRKRTTTQKLNDVLANNLLKLKKAECSYKSSSRIDEISKEIFLDNLTAINKSEIFSNFIDWHYEKNVSENGEYVFDSGRMNPFSENVIIAYLRVNDGVKIENIEKVLLFEEE